MEKKLYPLYKNPSWLAKQYLVDRKSLREIAASLNTTYTTIKRWLWKFGIPTRSVSEARSIKRWGQFGPANPMWGKNGALSPRWKGGKSNERALFITTQQWKKARAQVWKRDKETCQRCNKKRTKETKKPKDFHIHHIVRFAIKHLRATPSNLVLLCKKCHEFVHSKQNKNRDFLKGKARYPAKKKKLNTHS
jgi:hypothetical protein